MKRNNISLIKNIDFTLVFLYIIIIICGWFNLYSTNYTDSNSLNFFSTNYGKQLIWIFISFIIIFLILISSTNFFKRISIPFYIVTLLLLIIPIIFGSEVKGAKSWINLGFISIQPSEITKISISLLISLIISNNLKKNKKFKSILWLISIIILIPVSLILLQPDLGSVLVFFALSIVLYRFGLPKQFIFIPIYFGILFILTLLFTPRIISIYLAILFLLIYRFIFKNNKLWYIFSCSTIILFLVLYYFNLHLKYTIIILSILFILFALTHMFLKKFKLKWKVSLFVLTYIISIGFVIGVEFIFNNILQKHHRTRIVVLLGEENRLKNKITEIKNQLKLEKNKEKIIQLNNNLLENKKDLKYLMQGIGWNINQSKIAIGSGGFLGKGFLKGTQTKFNFVPEQSTDFIFCTIAEEWGFVGSSIFICLFITFIIRILIICENQKSTFTLTFGYCVAVIFSTHFIINIAMTLGLAPIIGIPLPFVSYGGSSFLSFSILLFIFLKLNSEKHNIL